MKSVISSHNKSILKSNHETTSKCATVETRATVPSMDSVSKKLSSTKPQSRPVIMQKEEYIGCSEPPFKQRFANHTQSFNKAAHKNSTRLSQYVWDLKDQSAIFSIKWDIQARSSKYKCGSGKCDLCLAEKLSILKSNPDVSLNKRSEIANKCRHKNKHKLSKLK